MYWKKLDSSTTISDSAAKILLAQTERQGPAGPVHLRVWEDSCGAQVAGPRDSKAPQGTPRDPHGCRALASAGDDPAT